MRSLTAIACAVGCGVVACSSTRGHEPTFGSAGDWARSSEAIPVLGYEPFNGAPAYCATPVTFLAEVEKSIGAPQSTQPGTEGDYCRVSKSEESDTELHLTCRLRSDMSNCFVRYSGIIWGELLHKPYGAYQVLMIGHLVDSCKGALFKLKEGERARLETSGGSRLRALADACRGHS